MEKQSAETSQGINEIISTFKQIANAQRKSAQSIMFESQSQRKLTENTFTTANQANQKSALYS
jgi:hypothetical protein